MERTTDVTSPPQGPSTVAADVATEEKKFHGWRLLGLIVCVVVVIALVSAFIDWAVIGPLEGRAY